jgi:hypothetical protein
VASTCDFAPTASPTSPTSGPRSTSFHATNHATPAARVRVNGCPAVSAAATPRPAEDPHTTSTDVAVDDLAVGAEARWPAANTGTAGDGSPTLGSDTVRSGNSAWNCSKTGSVMNDGAAGKVLQMIMKMVTTP